MAESAVVRAAKLSHRLLDPRHLSEDMPRTSPDSTVQDAQGCLSVTDLSQRLDPEDAGSLVTVATTGPVAAVVERVRGPGVDNEQLDVVRGRGPGHLLR